MARQPSPRRVGIVGFGHLGEFLTERILDDKSLELAFVWNRTPGAIQGKVDDKYILHDLDAFHTRNAEIIVEVAHPIITVEYGEKFLQHADFMCGSPTALADQAVEAKLRTAASQHGLYIPAGAFWGGEDIKKMADRNTLKELKITMVKHPTSFRLARELSATFNTNVLASMKEKTVLYNGPVRGLCPLAPNNVNTMAAGAIAAHNLGFDKVHACLIADPQLTESHIVDVEVWGLNGFHVKTVRSNPAQLGNVTGTATYNSFYSSLLASKRKGPGVHIC